MTDSIPDEEGANQIRVSVKPGRKYDTHVSPATRDALIDGLEVAMLGTTDGDLIDPTSNISAGEMFRLAKEYLLSVAPPAEVDALGLVTPGLTLNDDEVLNLVRFAEINLEAHEAGFLPTLTIWKRLQARAEDILNEQRAAGRSGSDD